MRKSSFSGTSLPWSCMYTGSLCSLSSFASCNDLDFVSFLEALARSCAACFFCALISATSSGACCRNTVTEHFFQFTLIRYFLQKWEYLLNTCSMPSLSAVVHLLSTAYSTLDLGCVKILQG